MAVKEEERPRAAHLSLPVPADRRRFPAAAADLVRPPRPRSAVGARPTIRTTFSFPKSCCSRRKVDRVLPKYAEWLDKYPLDGGAGRRARSRDVTRTWYPLGLQTSGRSGCSRSPGSRWRKYGGQLPSDEATLAVVQGDRRLHRRPRSAASRSASAPAILDTNVARVLFRVFRREGAIPKAMR